MFRPVPPDESGQDRSLGLPEQQGRRLKRAGIARKKGMAPPCPSALRRSTRSTAASGSISGAAPRARSTSASTDPASTASAAASRPTSAHRTTPRRSYSATAAGHGTSTYPVPMTQEETGGEKR